MAAKATSEMLRAKNAVLAESYTVLEMCPRQGLPRESGPKGKSLGNEAPQNVEEFASHPGYRKHVLHYSKAFYSYVKTHAEDTDIIKDYEIEAERRRLFTLGLVVLVRRGGFPVVLETWPKDGRTTDLPSFVLLRSYQRSD